MYRVASNRIKPAFSFMQCVFALVVSLLIVNSAQAMEAPDAVVKRTIDEVVDNIQSNRAKYRSSPDALYTMVEDAFIPAIHVDRMARLILGGKKSIATKDQTRAFAEEFKIFLIRSYASALLDYTGDNKVTYKPVELKEGADKAVVEAEFVATDGQKYPFTLFMSNRDDTSWRAYNVDVGGINFVSTYRSNFGGIISQKGVDGLIEDLKQKNEKLAI